MLYRDFKGKKLSGLGFGLMRLPMLGEGAAARVDEEKTAEMLRFAIENGVNYFDTAYSYCNGQSEGVLGKLLSGYPRDSYTIASKFPGHEIRKSYDPKTIFEEQLRRCRVEYFDFYLLHNVCEMSIDTFFDPKWGIIEYLLEQKRAGRIRHLGFSTHGRLNNMQAFLDKCGEEMEFCQIQLNYLDWTLQNAKEKYEMLTGRGIPVWVMEPVRGGKLANLPEEDAARLKAARPDESVAAWAFRFLQGLPNVGVVLSGMSTLEQMRDNIKTFSEQRPLNEAELGILAELAAKRADEVPCTGCRYCMKECPQQLDIPLLLSLHKDCMVASSINIRMAVDMLEEDKRPSACINCGNCKRVCPQNIEVPEMLDQFQRQLDKMPTWEEICREREKQS